VTICPPNLSEVLALESGTMTDKWSSATTDANRALDWVVGAEVEALFNLHNQTLTHIHQPMRYRCATMVDSNFDSHLWASQKTLLLVLHVPLCTTFETQDSVLIEASEPTQDCYGSKIYQLDICDSDSHLTLLTPFFCPYVWPSENDVHLVVSPEEEKPIHPLDSV
jgi:hypothetical protein